MAASKPDYTVLAGALLHTVSDDIRRSCSRDKCQIPAVTTRLNRFRTVVRHTAECAHSDRSAKFLSSRAYNNGTPVFILNVPGSILETSDWTIVPRKLRPECEGLPSTRKQIFNLEQMPASLLRGAACKRAAFLHAGSRV